MDTQEFRDDLGNLTGDPATGLELQLQDFTTKDLVENPNIIISSSTLYDFVTRAEVDAKKIKENKGEMVQLKPGAKKQKRQRTPPEELKPNDKQWFSKEEDSDYVGSTEACSPRKKRSRQ